MRKLFTLVLILGVLSPQLFAQMRKKAETGPRFGILVGGGLQTLVGKDYWGDNLDNKLSTGFHLGGNVMFNILPDLWLQPGLQLSVKGAKQEIITEDILKTTNLFYVEVPVNILFRPQLGDGHLLIGLGPYAAYGLFGNERTKISTITTELKVKFLADATEEPSTYVYYRGLDGGGNFLFGYELYNGIFLHLNAQMGALKINSDYGLQNDQTKKRNLGFSLSAGYRF